MIPQEVYQLVSEIIGAQSELERVYNKLIEDGLKALESGLSEALSKYRAYYVDEKENTLASMIQLQRSEWSDLAFGRAPLINEAIDNARL